MSLVHPSTDGICVQSRSARLAAKAVHLDNYGGQQKTHKKHKSPNKHHHHGGGAACPSSGVDLMNPRCPRGGRRRAYLFPCPRQSDL